MADIVKAPWTFAEVTALNRYQGSGNFHPFTCPISHHDGEIILIPTTRGWICQYCNYTQDWCHGFMCRPPETDGASSAFEAEGPGSIPGGGAK